MAGYLRIGQVAKELGISPYHVRKLCKAGGMEAEQTVGGQLRIPISEVERIRESGEIPPIPHGPDADAHDPSTPPSKTDSVEGLEGGIDQPSDDLKASREEVMMTQNKLETRKIERDLAEVEDFFDERQHQEQERQAEQERSAVAAQAARQRQAWLDQWLQDALDSLPGGTPQETKLKLAQAVTAALERRHPGEPVSLTRQIVEAAVAKALQPYQQAQETERAISQALGELPWGAKGFSFSPSPWEIQARLEAEQALEALPAGASLARKRARARQVVKEIGQQFQRQQAREDHQRTCEEMASDGGSLRGIDSEHREEARRAVRQELAKFPVGTPREPLEKARDRVLEPFQLRRLRRTLAEVGPLEPLLWHGTSEDRENAAQAIAEEFAKLPEDTERAELERVRQEVLADGKEEITRRQARQDHQRTCEEIASDGWSLWGIDSEHREEARQAVRQELAKFPVGTPREQLDKARDRALQPFQLRRLRRTLAEVGPMEPLLWNGTSEDRENAAQAIAEAFAKLPEDTAQPELERVRQEVLDDSKEEIKERTEIEAQVQSSLDHIDRYLKQEYEFRSVSARLQDERELRETIQPKLIAQLQDDEMDDEDLKAFIEDLVDEELGEEDQEE